MAYHPGAHAVSLQACSVSLRLGQRLVLCRVAVEVPGGKLTVLVGPNGAGKSSLLRVLSGDLAPERGRVLLDDASLASIPSAAQAQRRSVMSQITHVVFDFLVGEILRMGWTLGDRYAIAVREAAVAEVVADCELQPLLDRRFNTLSGGEQRRVQFARALLQVWRPRGTRETRYLLLDEPTANLDLAHERMVMRLSRACADDGGVGVLLVLHDLDLAARFADRIALMDQGRIVACGSPAQVLQADLLARIYQTPVAVEWHRTLGRVVVYSQ